MPSRSATLTSAASARSIGRSAYLIMSSRMRGMSTRSRVRSRGRTGLGQFHLGQDVGHVGETPAAVFPGQSQAEHAFPGPELQDFPGELGLPVQPGGQFFHFPGQALRLFLDPLMFR